MLPSFLKSMTPMQMLMVVVVLAAAIYGMHFLYKRYKKGNEQPKQPATFNMHMHDEPEDPLPPPMTAETAEIETDAQADEVERLEAGAEEE